MTAHSDSTHRVDEGRVVVGPPQGLPVVPCALEAVPKVLCDARVERGEPRALDGDDAADLVAARATMVGKTYPKQAEATNHLAMHE